MDRIINVNVNGEFVKKDSKNAGVQGEGNATQLHITMSEDWKSYSKRLIWRNALGENPTSVLLYKSVADLVVTQAEEGGGEEPNPLVFDTPVPSEALTEAGWCSFTIEGFEDSAPTKVHLTVTDHLLVKPNDSYNAPAEPTPTQAQQLQTQIDQITGDTAAIVQEAVDALEGAEKDMKVWEPWDAAKTYKPHNKVYRLGSSYICKKTNINVDPWSDVTIGGGIEGQYWQMIAQKGDRGENGLNGGEGKPGPPGPRGIDGVVVEAEGQIGFSVNEAGHLLVTYSGDTPPGYFLGEDGHLYLEV